jgi:hypothetical protein
MSLFQTSRVLFTNSSDGEEKMNLPMPRDLASRTLIKKVTQLKKVYNIKNIFKLKVEKNNNINKT